MNNKTKVIIGVGIAALLFMFRKQLFGGGNGGNGGETESPNVVSTGDGEATLDGKKASEYQTETALVDWRTAIVDRTPDYSNLPSRTTNATTSSNTNLTPRVDSAVFFSAPNSALTR
jgi:hypothetical protein